MLHSILSPSCRNCHTPANTQKNPNTPVMTLQCHSSLTLLSSPLHHSIPPQKTLRPYLTKSCSSLSLYIFLTSWLLTFSKNTFHVETWSAHTHTLKSREQSGGMMKRMVSKVQICVYGLVLFEALVSKTILWNTVAEYKTWLDLPKGIFTGKDQT